MRIYNETDKKHLNIGGCGVKVDNVLWVSELDGNGLYRIDLHSMYVEFVSKFPMPEHVKKLFYDVIYENGELIFIPFRADALLIYNIENKRFRSIEIKESPDEKFAVGILEAGILYLFPFAGNRIVKVDIAKEKVTCEERMIQYLKENFTKEKFFELGCIYQKEMYLPVMMRNIIAMYNIERNTYEYYGLGIQDNLEIVGYAQKDKLLYLLDNWGTVSQFSFVTKICSEVISLESDNALPFTDIIFYKNELWIIPRINTKIAVYCIEENYVSYLDIRQYVRVTKETTELFSKVFSDSGTMILYPKDSEVMVIINMETKKAKTGIVQFPFERNPTLRGFINEIGVKSIISKKPESSGGTIWSMTDRDN